MRRTADSHPVRVPPAALATVAFGAQHVLAGQRRPTKFSATLGAVVFSGSAWLICGSFIRFRQRKTTVNPVDVGAESLVTSGPNRLTRNPMYIGMVGILAAHAVVRRSPRALLPVALFATALDRFQIPEEEAVLREHFGAEFERYASQTPRWIGMITPEPRRRRRGF